ncbi:MAG: RecX family transcriptional regulator [Endomicrobiia bacterium]
MMTKEDDFQKAYEYSCRLLKIRDRSENEVTKKLLDKGFKENIVLQVIEKLKKNLYLDDKRFAVNYIEKNLYKPKSIDLIIYELKEIFEIKKEYLSEIDVSFYKKLQMEFLKKFVKNKFKNFDQQKVIRFLLNRGFDLSDIEIIISNIKNQT